MGGEAACWYSGGDETGVAECMAWFLAGGNIPQQLTQPLLSLLLATCSLRILHSAFHSHTHSVLATAVSGVSAGDKRKPERHVPTPLVQGNHSTQGWRGHGLSFTRTLLDAASRLQACLPPPGQSPFGITT